MNSLPTTFLDSKRKTVVLGKELGRGGEGAVHEVVGRGDVVAKFYFKEDQQRAEKLLAMPGLVTPELLKVAAWPTELLRDGKGVVSGFLMPNASGFKPVFKLYMPKPRLREFPTADWRMLIHAAANTARAFSTVHRAGFVIGDINHGNMFVGNDATVKLIDCDSFQVTSGNKTFFCTVGVNTHQPPEMQMQSSFAGITRTPNHDRFGLAVLIFQLLCMNRHPFAGVFQKGGEPPSIDEAIKGFRYAYSRDVARTQMAAPPGSLPIDALTPDLRELFEQAFAPGATKQGRPDADKWAAALTGLSSDLTVCGANRAHYFRKGLSGCPWCAIENANGVTLFPVIFVPGRAASPGGFAALWQEVERIPAPPALPQWPSTPPANGRPSLAARAVGTKARTLRMASWAAVGVAMLLSFSVASPESRAWLVPSLGASAFIIRWHAKKSSGGLFKTVLLEIQRDWEAIRTAWSSAQADLSFAQTKTALTKLKADHDDLPQERHRRLQLLHNQLRERQLRDHLDRFLIADAKISGVGDAKVAALASHGIDTAADVSQIAVGRVPGFGNVLSGKLVAWRRSHESTFRFDPARRTSAADTALVDRDIAMRSAKLQQELTSGLSRLRMSSTSLTHQRTALMGRLAELQPRYGQALTDVSVAIDDGTASIRLGCVAAVAAIIALSTHPPAQMTLGPQPNPTSQPLQTNPARLSPVGASGPAGPSLPAPSSSINGASTAARQSADPAPAQAQPPPSSVQPTPMPIGDVRLRQAANVRSAADSSASIVQVAAAGAVLHIFRKDHGWLQVGDSGPIGWVFSGLGDEIRSND